MNGKIESLKDLKVAAGAYRTARIIHAAVKLRLFDHLEKPMTEKQVAESANISLRGADILLDALAALGIVKKTGDLFQNTELAKQHLVNDSLVLHSLDHSEQNYRKMVSLPEVLKTGVPDSEFASGVMTDPEANRVFIRAMHSHGLERGQVIAGSIDLENVKTVVDVGGGPGSYLIAMLEKKPDLKCILVDHALTLKTAAKILSECRVNDRVECLEMDIFEGFEPFYCNADLVILSNILHIEGPEVNIRLLRRIHESLAPDGKLVIQDFFLDESGTQPQDYALFAVNMLVSTERGRAWRTQDLQAWLTQAGFSTAETVSTGMETSVLIAKKQVSN